MKDKLLAGRYAVSAEIGSGGMAKVYRCYDTASSTEVAVKHFPNATDVSRIEQISFEKELASLEKLQHPHIIKLLDHGSDSAGMPFLVLELMEHDISQCRAAKASTAFDGYDDYFEKIGYPVLCALEYAHGLHVTHRDVKPRNILIGRDGVVKLADFGIARLKGHLSGSKTLRDFESRPFGPPELDDGAYSDSRDVFSFGALCVWALSEEASLVDYAQLYQAADRIDVHPAIKPIIQRCLSKSPADRYENAILLKSAVDSVLRQRRTTATQRARPSARIKVSEKVKPQVKKLLGAEVEDIERLLTDDIRDFPTVSEWTLNGRRIPNEFAVIGAQFQYHIFFKQASEPFFLLAIDAPSPAVIQHRKGYQASCPVDFVFKALGKFIEPIDALDKLESAIRENTQEAAREVEHPLIASWSGILSAKWEIERQRTPPVPYSRLRVQGGQVFAVVSNTGSLEPGTRWTVKSGKYTVSLEVSHLNGDEAVFFWRSSSNNFNLPPRGEFAFDIIATETCLSRQEESLDRLARRQTANAKLLDILADPESVAPSGELGYTVDFPAQELDQSKQDAIRAALACKDILLIHGPPGTGKTKLIAFLIDSISKFETQPDCSASILLVSQTHVAIDNALETVAKINPSLNLLRISTTGLVAKGVEEYLIQEQSQRWKREVKEGSEHWIERYATQNGVNSHDVAKGRTILELAGVNNELGDNERQTQLIEAELAQQQLASPDDGQALNDVAINEDKLSGLATRRKYLLNEQKTLFAQVSQATGETPEVVSSWLPQDLQSLAKDFLGETAAHNKVKGLIEVRADWLMRFGRDSSFNSALCERSDVVAGTCIGFIGLKDIDHVEFDWCIIDEASKATVLDTIVPMVRAKKWVLVGDSKQLPPFNEFSFQFDTICDNLNVNKEELARSLFTQLESALPEHNQHVLRHQYRMCTPIAKLVAECFYPNTLDPGSRPPCGKILKSFGAPILWLDTSGFQSRFERAYGKSFTNECEIELIIDHIKQLFTTWDFAAKNDKILVLSPYTAQVSALWKAITSRFSDLESSVIETSTIDAVQGRQAKAVFLSLTRNEPNAFVDDAHRVNVAISRAEDLLVIVGNEKATRESSSCENLHKVLKFIDRSAEDSKIVRFLFGNRVR